MLISNLFKYWTYQFFSPGTVLKEKYAAFKSLLTHNKRAHELMAELEEIYYHRQKKDFSVIEKLCTELSRNVAGIVDNLSKVCPACYPDLLSFYNKIDAYIRFMTKPERVVNTPPYVLGLNKIDLHVDPLLVGGKALNLGIVRNNLKLPTPDGFVITSNAYYHFIEHNDLRNEIDDRLSAIDIDDTALLDTLSEEIRQMIMGAEIPPKIEAALEKFHQSTARHGDDALGLAMRSSAVGEDSRASFAGQYLTVLNVKKENMCDAYRKIIAGKYSSEAIYYRISYGFSDTETPMAVLLLNMVDAATSGVMYTADIDDPASYNMKIHAVWGLGELLVSGQTPADILTLSKEPFLRIVEKVTAVKPFQMVYGDDGGTESIPLNAIKSDAPSLDDDSAVTLAGWATDLEKYFQQPQDIEWAIDRAGNSYILQSRPLNTDNFSKGNLDCEFKDVQNELLLKSGDCAASGIGAGTVFNLENQPDLESVPEKSVLVARNAAPQYVKVINRLSAVVVDAGSSAGHFASVAREFGIPTLVNTQHGSTALEHGRAVTVHADGRSVYAGTVTQMLESPCARVNLIADSPFMRKLRYIMEFVSKLELVNPEDRSFAPQHCRSFHDIIRFAHEKAVQHMFHISDNRLRKLNFAKKLDSDIPMHFYILDVGGGLEDSAKHQEIVRMEDIRNRAMRALWAGLAHPDIQWGAFSHFDWEAHDRIVMSGGIASPKSTMFASHAVVSNDYMNLNLRFGYHFVIVDALCGPDASCNSILFRFSGGGADLTQRMLRAKFLKGILLRLGFEVSVKSDLVDAQFIGAGPDTNLQKLDMIGRLLGATRLMDMYLQDASMIETFVDDFMQGRYHFASVDDNANMHV
ncbi:MAG: hypothetical protein JRH03_08140 [Deltaproteobacteria bacterium]|nr:hypothetical protein [Deltaproteobacteria bacterium]